MKSLYNSEDVSAIIKRIEKLNVSSPRSWGKMNSSQMLAHCTVSLETAMGKNKIKRLLIGRLIAPFFRKNVLGEKPFSKNSPTDKSYIFQDERDFETEKKKLVMALKEFHEGGPSNCTTYPHPFFGKFTPGEWAIFQWKHLDHHLRQFGV